MRFQHFATWSRYPANLLVTPIGFLEGVMVVSGDNFGDLLTYIYRDSDIQFYSL